MSHSFIHLHCHSEYSLLESPLRIKTLLNACKDFGMSTVALTDNGVMYGAIDFYLQAKAMGIKPIIGCEMYLCQDVTVRERGFDRLILLAKDYQGYQHLVEAVSFSHLKGFYYKPRVDLSVLAKFSNGLIAISPGLNGPIGYRLRSNRDADARELAQKLKEIYKENFYLGIQKLDMPMEDFVAEESVKLGQELGIQTVLTNDVYYADQGQAHLRNIVTCIQTGRRLDDDVRVQFQSQEAYIKSSEEMAKCYPEYPEAVTNTVKIAEQCCLELQTDQVLLPRFDCPNGLSNEEYLTQLVDEGLKRNYPEITDEISERVSFELGIIMKMGYAPYFLIIYDFLDFCRRESIPFGPGRGSAAGSIVSYALNITKIDPLKYKLLFERFLNPDRVSMPDVDLDFCIRRRNEVIAYIVSKYGEDCVSQIITFGSMAARGVIRDVGRVLNVPLGDVDRIAKLIPSSPAKYTSIAEALEQVPELEKIRDSSDEFRELITIGMELEGISRHSSTHAAGVVISRDPLKTMVPLVTNDGQVTTQFAMAELEKVGMLKMDILGLRNLTVMDDAATLIRERHGIALDYDALPLDDEATYDLLCTGATAGIFQLESSGMRRLIKDLKPRVFEDIIALLALYRPGPLGSGMVNDFISNKSGETTVVYELDVLEPILKDTYGMIVYQEQVMQIASAVGGFSLGQADMLRRAMGKKKKSVMDQMRAEFMEGAKNKEFPADKAKKIFDLCYKFAEYGFNKSHSAAYAMISYQTAYLKAHYPQEYMAALLSSVLGVTDKVSLYISACKEMGISVLPPSVNESNSDFTVVKGGIRFGLGAVKNVGEGAIESIVQSRKEKGIYERLSDMCMRVDLRQVNKRVLESLIKSGAMDDLGNRSKLLGCYDKVLEQAQITIKERSNGQTSMFAQIGMGDGVAFSEDIDDYDVLSPAEMLRMEKEMVGLYISGHPLDQYHAQLEAMPLTISTLNSSLQNKRVDIMGMLSDCRRVMTKNKNEMLIGTLADLRDECRLLVFQSDNFETMAAMFEDDTIVRIQGRFRQNDDEKVINVDEMTVLDQSQHQRRLFLDIEHVEDMSLLEQVRKVARQYRGGMPLYFQLGDTQVLTHKKYWVTDDPLCMSQLENLLGPNKLFVV